MKWLGAPNAADRCVRRWLPLLLLVGCADDPEPPDPCGRLRCSPFPQPPSPRVIPVKWEFYPSVVGPELAGACRAGVANVEIHTSTGGFESYPCNANRVGQIEVSHDDFILVRLVDADGQKVAESPPEKALSPDRDEEYVARFYEDGGYARAFWNVFQMQNQTFPAKCSETVTPLFLTVTKDGVRHMQQTFACPVDGTLELVTHQALLEGTYLFTFNGINGAKSIPVTIGRNNAITEIDVTTP